MSIIELENIDGVFQPKNSFFMRFRKNFKKIILLAVLLAGVFLASSLFSLNTNPFKTSQANEIAGCMVSQHELAKNKSQGLEICLDKNLKKTGPLKKFCQTDKTRRNELCDKTKLQEYFQIPEKHNGIMQDLANLIQNQESSQVVGSSKFKQNIKHSIDGQEIEVEQGLQVNLDQDLDYHSLEFYCKLPERRLPNLCNKEKFKQFLSGEVLGVFEKRAEEKIKEID